MLTNGDEKAQTEIPRGEPLRDAWEVYRATPDYANTRKWAKFGEHLDGSLWAAFCAGWQLHVGGEKIANIVERQSFVLMELMQAYERRIRSDCRTQEELDKRPWECAEYLAAANLLKTLHSANAAVACR